MSKPYTEQLEEQEERISELKRRIAELEGSGQVSYQAMSDLVMRQGSRIVELESENSELKARWADMCDGMRKIEILEKGKDGG